MTSMYTKYEFRLTNGLSVIVESAWKSPVGLAKDLYNGKWFTDAHGWLINPVHVLMIRETDDSD